MSTNIFIDPNQNLRKLDKTHEIERNQYQTNTSTFVEIFVHSFFSTKLTAQKLKVDYKEKS